PPGTPAAATTTKTPSTDSQDGHRRIVTVVSTATRSLPEARTVAFMAQVPATGFTARRGVCGALTREHRARLLPLTREASFATDERIFEGGGQADRFWIIHTGTVALDVRMPGRPAAVIETVGAGEPLGWSLRVTGIRGPDSQPGARLRARRGCGP
ncbi:cyclic nucleotide-binding domain-containing protein, partial [Streptomyces flaveolus]|uniref:cyclic nucleotide-binding domain-containing protein n=1 Tax=Streptomyces flaveolus TaxID=67297 RepID=UPI0036830EDA